MWLNLGKITAVHCISLKHIHFIDKLELILIPGVTNSRNYLTLWSTKNKCSDFDRKILLILGSPYETLHDYVSGAVAPYFKSFVRESGKADREGDKMAVSMEKKIAELEMGLSHLQQNIDIPEITLTVHPIVSGVIKKASDSGIKPKVADFGDRVEDSVFLNALQNQVSKWIREIQKVCKKDLQLFFIIVK